MTSPKLFNLPPVPPELKSLTPYLQRADELKMKEPVMAYWCAYYAAQVGIGLKAKTVPCRNFLFELLGLLESMKQEIGPNDAIDMEAASAAYVENFALRVFNLADNEDRKGQSTRSTAKKFLAAAHFLDVLKTFPKSEVSDTNEEKIRYAKWKAADIAKAYREGRKPIPGPAGGLPEEEPVAPSLEDNFPTTTSISPTTSATQVESSSRSYSPPQIQRSSPPHIFAEDRPQTPPRRAVSPHLGVDRPGSEWERKVVTPGSWSTAATPGAEPVDSLSVGLDNPEWMPESPTSGKGKLHEPADDLQNSAGTKNVHFSSSVVGGSSTGTRSPEVSPKVSEFSEHVYSEPPVHGYQGQYFVEPPDSYSSLTPSAPPAPPSISTSSHTLTSAWHSGYTSVHSEPAPMELTPAMVTKAQRHSRFAISALDYEDREQAIKELRTALEALGA
ncbi:Vta1 like-domain-containing protein [Desarmillaria tabescens]|uniref:Vta1 like-domain-containing protein n=1 Tax=Armillaria tabescens TaxID=1929756 RepID=A0AA39TT28_ARMTA|nr:Vta1 like-domain-containing protein [Desarmillaria tabescens]KAK0465583.1 Vta1 like-domain-containing protein [Desarmillaria tabescens]